MPLRALTDVRFNQPILFAQNLEGKVAPINCLGVSETITWKVRDGWVRGIVRP
jgi:hypothetical protein